MVDEFMPVAVAAITLKRTREQVVRLVQRGVLAGEIRQGRWVVRASAVHQMARKQREPVEQTV